MNNTTADQAATNLSVVTQLRRARLLKIYLLSAVFIFPIAQVFSIWFFQGSKVDESEMVLFAVGFLGGELDPVWEGYGHLGMYLLGLIYYIQGIVSTMLGQFDSLTDYAAEYIGNGNFYIIARVFMAFCVMLATVVCALLLQREGFSRWLLILFVLLVAVAPGTVHYANYVRTDALITLFTCAILFAATTMDGFKATVWIAIMTAAAVACKISALPLGGILAVVMISELYYQRISWLQALSAGLLCLLLIVGFSPYMAYVDLFNHMVLNEYGGSVNIYRQHYSGFSAKLARLIELHVTALGPLGGLLALASLAGLFTSHRKTIAYAWLLVFFTVFPYWFGTTLRDYWFMPTYLLLAFLGFCSLGMLVNLANKYMASGVAGAFRFALILVLVSVPFKNSVAAYVERIGHQLDRPVSNKELARQWLEEHHLRVNPILIDKNFWWIYPSLYDPAHVRVSRKISRLFGYQRQGNRFLSSVFEKHLENYHSVAESAGRAPISRLFQMRLDFAEQVSWADVPEICSMYSTVCYQPQLHQSHHVEISSQDGNRIHFKKIGSDPYLVFKIEKHVPVDGSFHAHVNSDASAWRLVFDFGTGFSQETTSAHFRVNGPVAIRSMSDKPWVSRIGQDKKPASLVAPGNKILFVTSLPMYDIFSKYKNIPVNERTKIQLLGANTLRWIEDLTRPGPIKVFRSGTGAGVEVYDLGAYIRDNP